jgi:hypothetical protein
VASDGIREASLYLCVGSTSVATMHAIVFVVLILVLLCKVLRFLIYIYHLCALKVVASGIMISLSKHYEIFRGQVYKASPVSFTPTFSP